MFTINWINVKSGLVYGLLWGILAMFIEIQNVGNIFALDWKSLANTGVIAFVAFVIVLFKNMLTDSNGKFLGLTTVIPDKE